MSTMNWKVTLIGIIILLVPIVYAGIGLYNSIHALLGH